MSDATPGAGEILSYWALDLPWLAAFLLAAGLYLRAFRASRRRAGPGHPPWRAAAFCAGLVAIAIAVVSPLEHYGNQVVWVDFLGFLVLTMIAAPLVVLGAPLTLAFRVSSPAGRARLRHLYQSRAARLVTFPVFSWLAFAAMTYTWQFTSLTDDAAHNVFVRDLQQVMLLAVSLAFWLPALCSDPLRWRMPYPLRTLYVFVEMTHKGLFGGMFLSMRSTFHSWIPAHAPAWAPSPLADQRMAILILWIGGNIIFMVALGFLVSGWIQYEQRNAHRTDWRLALARAAELRHQRAVDQVFQKTI